MVVVVVVVVVVGGGGARLEDRPVGDGEGGVGVVGAWEGGAGGGLGVVPLFEDHGLVARARREDVAGGAALGVLVRGGGGEEDGEGWAPVAAFGAERFFLRLGGYLGSAFWCTETVLLGSDGGCPYGGRSTTTPFALVPVVMSLG